MKAILTCIALLCVFVVSAQQNMLPLHSFYKDQLLANKTKKIVNTGFYPVSEAEYDLITAINDSSKQYYDVTETLFKKYLFEISGKDYHLNFTPMINFQLGKDLLDTNDRRLFQNTRGILVEGDLFKKFSFSTSFYENQSRFSEYETNYYETVGELYPKTDSSYTTANAVIPGAARTKEFKGDGFDYAYAIGNLVYAPIKALRISAGNNQQFVGDGYRSILLSDNSYSNPYYRVDWDINSKFSFIYHRARLINLMRRPATGSVESYYETKGYSINYFTYKPTEKINISLFEGSVWNRGDSISSKNSHPLYYNPIPVVSSIVLKGKNEVSSLLGLNLGMSLNREHRLYGQVAINNLNAERIAFQLGYRGYRFFKIKDLMLQLELNSVPAEFYNSDNPRLNYTHYNLPLAHAKGNGFNELLIRLNYEVKRVYIDHLTTIYFTKDYNEASLLPVYRDLLITSDQVVYSKTELGYRFNRKMNFTIFGALTVRSHSNADIRSASIFSAGIRTTFLNHYTDF